MSEPAVAAVADRVGLWLFSAARRASRAHGWLFVTVGLAGSWGVARWVGGAGAVAPHWFYLPVVYAAARFGWRGAATTGALAGIVAGPLTPLAVDPHTAQPTSDWTGRMVAFVALGLIFAWVLQRSRASLELELGRVRFDRDLHRALANHQLHLVYQPIVVLDTGDLVGVEALVRWHHPELGTIPPSEFIPMAEASGSILELDRTVLELACTQLVEWRGAIGPDRSFRVAVNLSAQHLSVPELPAQLEALLDRFSLPADALCVEITETALVADLDASITQLTAIRALGIEIAVDDFGTGYSSLSYLHRFPADCIKIDQSFVGRLQHDRAAFAVTRTIIELARSLGLRTIAEGVETSAQRRTLVDLGADYAQGYHIAAPTKPETITALLHSPTRHWNAPVIPSAASTSDLRRPAARAEQVH